MAIFRPYSSSDALRSDRSAGDRQRHRGKLREAIRDNIADIISEESIIGRDRDRIIKVPIRGIKEYRFVYGDNQPQVGSGDGETEPGQVVGKAPKDGEGAGRAGDQPGIDYYETDVTLDELIEIMFEDLELPDMERKILREVMSDRIAKRKGYRRAGVRVHLDRRRTAKARIRRKIATHGMVDASGRAPAAERGAGEGGDDRFPFRREDLTYKRLVEDTREESNAVVLCIMDTSGSMDSMKKYLARSFFFLLFQFVSTKYQNVDLVFIGHHTQAREVTEEEFFHKGESGGTLISSGYNKALEIIHDRYHPILVERLRISLFRRRQFRFRQCQCAEGRQGALRHLQPVRLWRDQAARLALLRELDARHVPPPRGRQFPVGADRAQGRHLAELQGVPVAGSGQRDRVRHGAAGGRSDDVTDPRR